MITEAAHDLAPKPSDDREQVQLLLTRLRAAEHALATEIAEGLEVSEEAAFILARMRIEEVIGASGRVEFDDDRVQSHPDERYCRRCWALLRPETPRVFDGEGDFFATCIYCARPTHSEDEEERAA